MNAFFSGAWDPSIRIEPPAILPSDKKHKQKTPEKFEEVSLLIPGMGRRRCHKA
jgi:hypothetical protein